MLKRAVKLQPPIALVLLPGMDGTGVLFADFVAELGAGVTPLILSYPAERHLDYAGLTDFVRKRLPRDRPFVLLGESFSGPVAIALAASRPPGLVGLILSCTFARNPAPLLRRARSLVGVLPISAKLSGLAAPILLGLRAPSALRVALRTVLEQVPMSTVRGRLRAVLSVDYSARLRKVRVPILYLQATRDRIVGAASARHILALMPAARLVVLKGPHLLLQAAPLEAAIAVKAFMAALPKRKRGPAFVSGIFTARAA